MVFVGAQVVNLCCIYLISLNLLSYPILIRRGTRIGKNRENIGVMWELLDVLVTRLFREKSHVHNQL